MRNALLIGGSIALLMSSTIAAEARSSASGPRGPSGGVEFAPVDTLGPTLAPDQSLTPDSGWNHTAAGGGGVLGPHTGPFEGPTLFGPAAQKSPPPTIFPVKRHRPRIILQH